MTDYRMLTPAQLQTWAEDNEAIMRLRTDRDVLPGGYMAALAPMLVAWNDSSYQDTDGFLILRNVNYGGNSFERTTVLQSVRVPLDGLETAELILVPSSELGLLSPVHHVQLRFLFSPEKIPQLLNLVGAGTGTDAAFPDLVFSWESWRLPHRRFSLKEGMDDSTYGLSLRAFTGPQRYLEDGIRRRDWFAYRLRLPGGRIGVQELFMVCVALGDGVARDTIHRLLQQGEAEWLAHAPAGKKESDDHESVWIRLSERLRAASYPARMPHPRCGQRSRPITFWCAPVPRWPAT
jgi:hypothetical protein